MTRHVRQAIVERWPPGRVGSKEKYVSITRSPDSTRSGPGAGSGPGRPRGGLRLAGFAVRLTLGARLLAILTVLAGALVLPDLAPGMPAGPHPGAPPLAVARVPGNPNRPYAGPPVGG